MDWDDILICRCEEVTRSQIIDAIGQGCRTVSNIKRMTRAGMGACQGRTCCRLVTQLLQADGVNIEETTGIEKPRFPVVPCSIDSLGEGVGDEKRI